MVSRLHKTYRNLSREIRHGGLNSDPLWNPVGKPVFTGEGFESSTHGAFKIAVTSLICGAALVVVGFFVGSRESKDISRYPFAEQLLETDQSKDIQKDVALMKRILAGLVQSVDSLSRESRTPGGHSSNTGLFPVAVQVVSEKANLRSAPSRSALLLSVVPHGAELLATGSRDGWLKVTTPKGEDAWVHGDLVDVRGGGR